MNLTDYEKRLIAMYGNKVIEGIPKDDSLTLSLSRVFSSIIGPSVGTLYTDRHDRDQQVCENDRQEAFITINNAIKLCTGTDANPFFRYKDSSTKDEKTAYHYNNFIVSHGETSAKQRLSNIKNTLPEVVATQLHGVKLCTYDFKRSDSELFIPSIVIKNKTEAIIEEIYNHNPEVILSVELLELRCVSGIELHNSLFFIVLIQPDTPWEKTKNKPQPIKTHLKILNFTMLCDYLVVAYHKETHDYKIMPVYTLTKYQGISSWENLSKEKKIIEARINNKVQYAIENDILRISIEGSHYFKEIPTCNGIMHMLIFDNKMK
jgi:hypothetical protein